MKPTSSPMAVHVRNVNTDENGYSVKRWCILESPTGEYPAGGYTKRGPYCNTKKELVEHLEALYQRPIKAITI